MTEPKRALEGDTAAGGSLPTPLRTPHRRPSRALPILAVAAVSGAATLGACSSDGDPADPASPHGEVSTDAGVGPAACKSTRDFFAQEVWPILGTKCATCHAPGAPATTGEGGKRPAGFTLEWESYPDFIDRNLAGIGRMVLEQIAGVPKLLVKPTGGDAHGGGAVLTKDSREYAVLAELAQRTSGPEPTCPSSASALSATTLLDWPRTFRKAAINLGGRLPRADEAAVADEAAFDAKLDALMTEPAFFERVKEIWNDALLTSGGARAQTSVFQLDGNDFPYAKIGQMGSAAACATKPEAEKAACVTDHNLRWSAIGRALVAEPLELIAHVVRKNAPFTEVLTAGYGMSNPQLAPLYGLEGGFPEPSVENEGDWREVQVVRAKLGPLAHAGVLTTPGFLGRWVSTPTNRNRARSRVVHKVFLATDVLQLARRPVDTSALTGVANAPRNSQACTVCHLVVDPVANAFSNFSDSSRFDQNPKITAATNPHQEMLPPGLEGEAMPGGETKMLSWLGNAVGNDRRFAVAVTRVTYEGIVGRAPLAYPTYGDPATFGERFTAWAAQDAVLREAAASFVARGHDYKSLVRTIVKSPFFRAAKAPSSMPAALSAELGPGHLLSPEELDRKLQAFTTVVHGDATWRLGEARPHRLLGPLRTLYGGIDAFAITRRADAANAVIAAVATRLAEEVACRTAAWDFTRPASQRALFPHVELTTVPATGEADVRKNIAFLLDRAWGGSHAPADPDVDLAYGIFRDAHAELSKQVPPPALEYTCQGNWDRGAEQTFACGAVGQPTYNPQCTRGDAELPVASRITEDKHSTIGSWMAVLAFVLSDPQFLFE